MQGTQAKRTEANPVVLVTGASRGIGRATALAMAEQGYAVAVNYLSNGLAAQSVVSAIEARGGEARALQADVGDEASVKAMFRELDAHFDGPLMALVNNAGILLPQMKLVDMDAARVNHLLTQNVTSCFLCCREAIKRMGPDGHDMGGAIVNVSSAASRIGAPHEYIDYAATKGAVDTLTLGLSKEVAEHGIRVNAVRPGFIDTDIHAAGGEPGRIARLAPSIPLKRGGTPEEVANAIVWLLSDEASYVTGTFIDVAGGR
ncbi:MAG: SDR family oxidoreductase [Saccharospirillum sp.]|nr:SDR family oxidoreductase [Saccharospirillum sp.]